MDLYGKEAASIDVGSRLRVIREERGVSIRALARISGLSANALSMIERGLTSPSVSTLHKVAEGLEVPITAFFRQEPARSKIVFRKAAERVRVNFMRGLWEGLGGESFTGRIEPFMLTLENGGSSGRHAMLHTGHEFVFCLRGQLEYEVNDQVFLLESGDSLIFAAQLLHRWRNPGTTVTNAVIVLAGYEENEHPAKYHLAAQNDDNENDEELNQLDIETPPEEM